MPRRRPFRRLQGAAAGAASGIKDVLAMMLQRQYAQQIAQENMEFSSRLQQQNLSESDRLQRGRSFDEMLAKGEVDPEQRDAYMSGAGVQPSMARRIAAVTDDIEKATSPETVPPVKWLGAQARARRIPEIGFGPMGKLQPEALGELPSRPTGPTSTPEFDQILGVRSAELQSFPDAEIGEETIGEGTSQQKVSVRGKWDPDLGKMVRTEGAPKGPQLGQQIAASNITEAGTRGEKLTTLGAEEATRRRAELQAKIKEYGGLLPHQRDAAFRLADDFTLQSKDFFTRQDAFRTMSQLYARQRTGVESPAADIGMIFNLMKTFDPPSTVREGEQATASNAAAVPERIRNMYNRLLGTGERLTDTQRTDFMQTAATIYRGSLEDHNERIQLFTGRATAVGVPPDLVIRAGSESLAKESMTPRQRLENR